jgi:signal transduction histidine kinase
MVIQNIFRSSSGKLEASGRLVLVFGFGTLLLTVALSAADTLRVLQQYRQQDDRIRGQFLLRNRLLNDIRSEVYLSGTWVRDYLLDPDPGRAEGFGNSLAEVRAQMENDLTAYAATTAPVRQTEYEELRRELDRYWAVIDPVLQWDAQRRRTEGYIFLRDEVFPRRASTLEMAGRIAGLNEQQLNSGNERTADLLSRLQLRMEFTLLGALIVGAGLATFVTRRILALERHAQVRFIEVEEARSQLARLSARLVEVQEEERKSLSRELHDEVGQALSAVLIEARNLTAGLGRWPGEQTRQHAESIRSLAEGAVRVVRNMSLLLRPSMLDDLGLIPALRWQARETARRTGLGVTVEATIAADLLPEEYKTCIYRIVQEALHNASRHAQAGSATVRVEQKQGKLEVSIQDDGRGFDAAHSKGMGLLGIEERAAQLGGAVRVKSDVGAGTAVIVELPFAAPATAHSPSRSMEPA